MVQGLLQSRRFRRDNGCYFTEKKSQIDTENDKSPSIFHFSKFLRISRQILETSWIGMF